MTQYTVVGVYPDNLDKAQDAEGNTYVEWVEAARVVEAIEKAQAMYPERANAMPVAVFEGHRVDQLFDKGLASDG